MRNSLPLYYDATILAFALLVVMLRIAVIRRGQGRWFTIIFCLFTGADIVKFGPVNDLLVTAADARSVRVIAQVLTVAAAMAALVAARDAVQGSTTRARKSMVGRYGFLFVVVGGVLACLDLWAGNRSLPIEIAAPDISLLYFTVYSGTIVVCDGYAIVKVMSAYYRGAANRRISTAGIAVVGLFLATGLNSITLLWYAVSSKLGHIGEAERLQRDSNGNVYALFTLVISSIALVGTIRYIRRRTAVSRQWEQAIAGLPLMWEFLTTLAPEVRLQEKGAATLRLGREAEMVRWVSECVDAVAVLGCDIRDVIPGAGIIRGRNAPSWVGHGVSADEVLTAARRWSQTDWSCNTTMGGLGGTAS